MATFKRQSASQTDAEWEAESHLPPSKVIGIELSPMQFVLLQYLLDEVQE